VLSFAVCCAVYLQVLLKVTLPVPKDAHSSGLDSAGVRGTVLPASGCVFDSAAAGVTTSEWRPGERCFMQVCR